MITSEDVMRTKGEKVRKLENLAKACAEAKDDGMKKMLVKSYIKIFNSDNKIKIV